MQGACHVRECKTLLNQANERQSCQSSRTVIRNLHSQNASPHCAMQCGLSSGAKGRQTMPADANGLALALSPVVRNMGGSHMERITLDGLVYEVLTSSEIFDPGLTKHPLLAIGWPIKGIKEALIVARPGHASQFIVYRMKAGHFSELTKIR